MDFHNLLAGGGIAAVVVAGWNQVKAAFAYVSSVVLVVAEVDSCINRPLDHQLRYHDWKLVPGGKHFYAADFLMFRDGVVRRVPFALPPNRAIYRKGWRLLFVNIKENATSTYTFVRGTVDFRALVAKSIQDLDDRTQASGPTTSSRFSINKVFGREKGAWANSGSGNDSVVNRSASSGSSGSPAEISPSASFPSLRTALDLSFMYESRDWIFSKADNPFEYLYFEPEIMRYIEQAVRWLAREKWHIERHIPWRRGWLLYGPPGTGKSSIAVSTARKLGIPIYQFNLSTLSDQELVHEWNHMQCPCVALLEDFDTVFKLRENVMENKSLTFDCVLNTISGISARQGVFLMVTTNHLEHIDPAMGVTQGEADGVSTRPGRIDTVIKVGNMSAENQVRLAQRVLRDWPELIGPAVANHPQVTPAQFEEICVQLAYRKIAEEEKELGYA